MKALMAHARQWARRKDARGSHLADAGSDAQRALDAVVLLGADLQQLLVVMSDCAEDMRLDVESGLTTGKAFRVLATANQRATTIAQRLTNVQALAAPA